MPILTLTTDFGTKSFDIAALKGKLLCASPSINIIDISHDIEVFDIRTAAYELKNASLNFPKRTIHFTNINIKEGKNRYLIIDRNTQYYICPDNGFVSLMFPDDDFKAYVLEGLENDFSYQEINKKLCEIVKLADEGIDITLMGTITRSYLRSTHIQPSVMEDMIRASVIHVDKYFNAILNIDKATFYNFVGDSQFTISIRSIRAHKISKHYSDVDAGELVCLFNDAGLLEIGVNTDKATDRLGLSFGKLVLIEKM